MIINNMIKTTIGGIQIGPNTPHQFQSILSHSLATTKINEIIIAMAYITPKNIGRIIAIDANIGISTKLLTA
jgi:hypothetical protein